MDNPLLLTTLMASAGQKNHNLTRTLLVLDTINRYVPGVSKFVADSATAYWRRSAAKVSGAPVEVQAAINLLRRFDSSDKKPVYDASAFDSILFAVARLPQTRFIRMLTNGVAVVAHKNAVALGEGIFVRVVTDKYDNDGDLEMMELQVYSHSKDLMALQRFVADLEDSYRIHKSNKLGDRLYYFNHMPTKLPRLHEGGVNFDMAPRTMPFGMTPFHTTRSLGNLYGDAVAHVRKRVRFFLDNRAWYERKGIPYTLGVLLYGPPGSGKTSVIKALANDCERHVFSIHLDEHVTRTQLTNVFFNDNVTVVQDGITQTFMIPVKKRVLVFEDIDCMGGSVVRRRDERDEPALTPRITPLPPPGLAADLNLTPISGLASSSKQGPGEEHSEKLTLSTLLNVLDGVLETPGRIVVMTSNHPEMLDKALIRPGRIDVMVKLDRCTPSEIRDIVEGITDRKLETGPQLVLPDRRWTPAEVCQRVLLNFDDPEQMMHSLCHDTP